MPRVMPRLILVVLSCGTLSIAAVQAANLPQQQLPVYGGSGGTAFNRSCGSGKVLTGLRFRKGLVLDAVGLLCRPVTSNGQLGSETTVGTLAGGGGGTSGSVSCLPTQVIFAAKIHFGSYVDGIELSCGPWTSHLRQFNRDVGVVREDAGNTTGGTSKSERCEASTQPAKGIRGRAASVVDAIGFICDEP